MSFRNCRSSGVCGLFFLCITLLGQGGKPKVESPALSVPMKTFTDQASGVSFTYPYAWKFSPANQSGSYLGSMIAAGDVPARAVVGFSPRGNYYAKTNLNGLEFTFVVVAESSQESCYQRIGKDHDPADKPPEALLLGGREFFHISTSDAGMCHQAQREVYATYGDPGCYLFEATFNTLCAGVADGTRELTPADMRALHRHLDAIIQTVRINPPQGGIRR